MTPGATGNDRAGYRAVDPPCALRKGIGAGSCTSRSVERSGQHSGTAYGASKPICSTRSRSYSLSRGYRSGRATQCGVAFGEQEFETLVAYLAFIRTAHYWTETHPELAYEPDIAAVMQRHPDLAALLLDQTEAKRVAEGEAMRKALAELTQAKQALS